MIFTEMKSIFLGLLIVLSGCSVVDYKGMKNQKELIQYQFDVQSIKNLQARYLQLYDAVEGRDPQRPKAEYIVEQLFTEDGAWQATSQTGSTIYEGEAELIAMFKTVEKRHAADPGYYVKHLSMNPQITIDGNRARLKASFLVLHSSKSKKENLWLVGDYNSRLEKNDKGSWRFTSITAVIDSFSVWNTK